MQDAPKAVWSIPYVSLAFFPCLKQNFIAYHSSKVSWRPDCIFEIHQLWELGFSRVYSNCCCSCWFEPRIIEIGQSFHKTYSHNILNFQESTTILNVCTKESLETYWIHFVYISIRDLTLDNQQGFYAIKHSQTNQKYEAATVLDHFAFYSDLLFPQPIRTFQPMIFRSNQSEPPNTQRFLVIHYMLL